MQDDDVLICPRCKGELFLPVYRLAQPRNSAEPYKQAKAYFCATCQGTFPCGEVRPKRDAGNIIRPTAWAANG